MSNIATVRKEVQILRRALAPKEEPEWAKNAREINKMLVERERILNSPEFLSLSPREVMELEMSTINKVLDDMKKQGYWGKQE